MLDQLCGVVYFQPLRYKIWVITTKRGISSWLKSQNEKLWRFFVERVEKWPYLLKFIYANLKIVKTVQISYIHRCPNSSSVLRYCPKSRLQWHPRHQAQDQSGFHLFHTAMPTAQLCSSSGNLAKHDITKPWLITFDTCQIHHAICESRQAVCLGDFRRNFLQMMMLRHSWWKSKGRFWMQS